MDMGAWLKAADIVMVITEPDMYCQVHAVDVAGNTAHPQSHNTQPQHTQPQHTVKARSHVHAVDVAGLKLSDPERHIPNGPRRRLSRE